MTNRCSPGSETLLPCPFCSGADVGFGRTGQKWQTVACNECGAEGPCTEIDRDLIIEKWNTRNAGVAATTGSAVAMREALKPFANISLIRDADPGALNDMIDGPDLAITPKDVRRARAALAAAPQAQEGEPVAWLYELAHYIKPSDEDPHRDWRLVVTITPPPTIPKDGVRNVQPLYTSVSRPQQLPQK